MTRPTGGKRGRPKPPVPDDPRVKPALPDKPPLWKAIEVEARYWSPAKPWPSSASVGQVAAVAGVTRRTIRQRRKDPLYRAALEWYLLDSVLSELAERDRQKAAERARAAPQLPPSMEWSYRSRVKWAGMDDASRARLIAIWARRCWHEREQLTGPIAGDLDARNFRDPKGFAAAIVAAGAVPMMDMLEALFAGG